MAEGSTSTRTANARKTKTRGSRRRKNKRLPPYHIVLLDDNDHSHEYVIEMLKALFGYPDHQGMQLAQAVDTQKKAIIATTHKERAELKREQIHAFGADYRVPNCLGSMSAMIIPAE